MIYSDILIHIDEELDESRLQALERDLGDRQGVVCACVAEHQHHLMLVDFDPTDLRPSELIKEVRAHGLHAEMIGL